MAHRCQQINLEDECVAWNNLLAELHVVNLHEVCGPALWLLQRVQHEQTATLCHRLNLQHARHHRLLREVSLEERLVGGDILDADNRIGTQRDNLINQLHGVAVGQQFANLVDVHYWLLIGVVNGCLDFVLADLATHLAGELVIDGVSRTGGDDATLDGLADKCHIADDVEQLMACALVLPYQWLVLNVTQLGSVAVFR